MKLIKSRNDERKEKDFIDVTFNTILMNISLIWAIKKTENYIKNKKRKEKSYTKLKVKPSLSSLPLYFYLWCDIYRRKVVAKMRGEWGRNHWPNDQRTAAFPWLLPRIRGNLCATDLALWARDIYCSVALDYPIIFSFESQDLQNMCIYLEWGIFFWVSSSSESPDERYTSEERFRYLLKVTERAG